MQERYTFSLRRTALAFLVLFSTISVQSFGQNPAQQRFHFVVHDTLELADIGHLVHALEGNYERVKNDLRVPSLPQITVQVWSDEDAYQDAMEALLGMRFPGSRGYVTGDRELRLLYHRRLSAQKEAVHEFAHVVSLTLNSNFGNNPRWLWEAVAMYAAEEFRDPKEISYLLEGDYPSLAELNTDFNSGRNIYDVGYMLIEYIVTAWDYDRLIALIKSNGAIEETLGIRESEFEKEWQKFVEKKYL